MNMCGWSLFVATDQTTELIPVQMFYNLNKKNRFLCILHRCQLSEGLQSTILMGKCFLNGSFWQIMLTFSLMCLLFMIPVGCVSKLFI